MRTRERKVTIRMTDDEHQSYRSRLRNSGMKVNIFGIRCLLEQPITVIEEMPELIRQLKAIGNNLNQIARAANAGQSITPLVVTELDAGVKELWLWLRRTKVVDH